MSEVNCTFVNCLVFFQLIKKVRALFTFHVDGKRYERSVFGDYGLLRSKELFVGGAPRLQLLADELHTTNFRGCLAEVSVTLAVR